MLPRTSYFLWVVLLLTMTNTSGQQPELVIPVGHTENVVLVNYSPDGKTVVTASYDNTVKIWNARNGRLLYSLGAEKNWQNSMNYWARSVNFSPDSKRIVTAWDSTAQIWEVQSGRLLKTLKCEGALLTAGYSPDGSKIVTADEAYEVIIWNAKTGERLKHTQGYTPWVNDAHFSPNGKFVVATAKNNESLVKLLDAQSGKLIFNLKGHRDMSMVNIARFSPDNKYLVSASNDHTVIIWDLQSGKLVHRLESHTKEVINVNYSPDGNNIVTASADNTAKVWNAKTGELLFSLVGHSGEVGNALYSADGKNILTSSRGERTSIVWDAKTGKLLYTIGGPDNGLNIAIYSPDDKYILAGAINNTAQIFDAHSGRLLTTLQGHTKIATDASYSPDGKIMVTTSEDGTGKIWDVQTGRLINILKGHTAMVNNAVFSPDGKTIVTTSNDSTAKIWDVQSGNFLSTLKGHTDWLNMALFSPDGKTIVTTSNDNTPKLWNAKTGKLLSTIDGNNGLVSNGCFSKDGKIILSPSINSTANLWDVQTGKLLRSLQEDGEEYNIKIATFSPDDKKVFTAFMNGVIKIWDTESGKLLQQLKDHTDMVNTIIFSWDGEKMITASADKTIKIWNASTGQVIYTLEAFADFLSISSDNKKIASTSYFDHTLKIWDLVNGNLIKTIPYSGTMYAIDWKYKEIISHENSQVFVMNFETGKNLFSSIAIDENGFLTKTKNNFYESSPVAAQWLFWRKDNKLYDFDQWDLQYNRPDKVLEALGNKDTALIGAYRKAYLKRIRKMQVDTSMFRNDYHLPETEILNLKQIEGESKTATINLKVKCYDKDRSNTVKKLFVTVNGNPLYGTNGLSIKGGNVTNAEFNIPVSLSNGPNTIKVSCLNNRAAESLRQSVYINYEPALPVNPKTYYIGIGVSNYKDSTNNLRYADKDVKDIASSLQQKYPDAAITLLVNEKVTREAIKAVKQQLLQTKPDDKVIISFSGHGVIDKNYDFYFATYDIDFKNPFTRGLSYDEIEWLLDSIPSRNKLVLMDACHSGELDKEGNYNVDMNDHPADNNVKEVKGLKVTSKDSSGLGLKNTFEIMQGLFANIGRGNGATVISAAAGTEFAYEGNNWANGVFTYCTIQGLAQNKADIDKDGIVTVTELQEYVSEQVEKLTNGRQKPTSRQTNFDNNWQIW